MKNLVISKNNARKNSYRSVYTFIKFGTPQEKANASKAFDEIQKWLARNDINNAAITLRAYMVGNRPEIFDFMRYQGPKNRAVFDKAMEIMVPVKVTKNNKTFTVLKSVNTVNAAHVG